MVWIIGVLKLLQIGRLRSVHRDFEERAVRSAHADELFDLAATMRHAAGSRVIAPLASIASSSPFIGLFGTVYGIMDAFVRIGAAKSASLPVVAPAIGEALITT